MPRKRDPKRDEAFRLYQKYGGNITNLAIARELGVSNKKISVWKTRDRWQEALAGDDANRGKADIHNEGLNERRWLFCIYYVKSFNATQAAVKAGYSPASAHVTGQPAFEK